MTLKYVQRRTPFGILIVCPMALGTLAPRMANKRRHKPARRSSDPSGLSPSSLSLSLHTSLIQLVPKAPACLSLLLCIAVLTRFGGAEAVAVTANGCVLTFTNVYAAEFSGGTVNAGASSDSPTISNIMQGSTSINVPACGAPSSLSGDTLPQPCNISECGGLFVQFTLCQSVTNPFIGESLFSCTSGANCTYSQSISVSETIEFEVVLSSNLVFAATLDPGIPIGMTVSPNSASSWKVQWTPPPGSQGALHIGEFVIGTKGAFQVCPVQTYRLSFPITSTVPMWQYIPPATDYVNLTPGQALLGHTLECMINATWQSSLRPKVYLVNSTIFDQQVDLLSACGGSNCLTVDSLVTNGTTTINRAVMLNYQARTAVDDGKIIKLCFGCTDSADLGPAAITCVSIAVSICSVYINQGMTLESLARRYHLDRNWRRMWNLNPWLPQPNSVLHSDVVLRIGSIYKVQRADTLVVIAARFQTTVKKLMQVNPNANYMDLIEGSSVMQLA
eukprot:764002-Hanusia_phi.AAC.7